MYKQRFDKRKFDEMRPINIELDVIPQAIGSAKFQIGGTVAIAGVFGPKELHPRHLRSPKGGVLRVYYDMMSFSVSERIRPGPNRRDTELGRVIRGSLEPSLLLQDFPETGIYLYVYIIQANAGTRCAAISAASLALAHAGIPMKDIVSAVAVGKIGDKIVVDLDKKEEDYEEGATDIPLAMMSRTNKITLLQLDGEINDEELLKAIKLGEKSCKEIAELQKKALRDFYSGDKK
jgi:exosome complex component RRP41